MEASAEIGRGASVERDKREFSRDAVVWVLVALNTLAALNSTNFFVGKLGTGVAGWLMMNTCAPSIALFVAGFLLASPVVMVAGAVMMFRYGTGGLFVFGWDGYNLIPQIGHILMTLAVIYVGITIVRHRKWKALGLGLALGVAILIPLTIVQGQWFAAHPEMMEMLFAGEWGPVGQ
jgi:hypothetical protein